MITFRFSGGSDDIVTVIGETDSTSDTEEFYSNESGAIMWRATVRDPEGPYAVAVTALYLDSGNWHFAAGQDSAAWPLPEWPISIRQSEDCHYSAELVIVAPDGAVLTDIWPGEEKDSEASA